VVLFKLQSLDFGNPSVYSLDSRELSIRLG